MVAASRRSLRGQPAPHAFKFRERELRKMMEPELVKSLSGLIDVVTVGIVCGVILLLMRACS